MAPELSDTSKPAYGLGGTLRLIAIMVVLALGLNGMLVVFDIISLESLASGALKLGMLAAIGAVATSVVWMLTRVGRG
jgi:hypothetical protein